MTDSIMLDAAPQEAIPCDLPTMPLSAALRYGSMKNVLLYAESTVRKVVSEQIANPDISRRMDEGELSSSLRVVVVERVMKRFDLSKYNDGTGDEIQGEFAQHTQEALVNYCNGLAKRGRDNAQAAPCSACGK